MGRRTVLLVVAIVIAAVGATLVFLYVQGVDNRAVAGQERVQVLSATEVIAAGESVEDAQAAGKLALTSIPSADVLDGALESTETIQGELALTAIYPKEQILAAKFGAAGAQQSITIPDGTMAVSVQLDDPSRVAGFVTPGSSVAVFLSGKPNEILPDGSTKPLPDFARLLLPEVQVIGVGDTTLLNTTKTDTTGAQTTEQIPKTLLTLSLTQQQAEKVIFGSRNGILTFGLLNEKSVVRPGRGVIAQNLFD